jgi:dihydrodipicolinate synthase/N-acetylneuraminate lyase
MQQLSGLFAPVATPFTDDGSRISEVRLARLIRHLLSAGVHGLAVATDMGEFCNLGHSERKTLLEIALREAKGKPVIANISTLSTALSLDLGQHASRHGARAAILMPPYYGTLTEDEFHAFFHTIANHCDLPLIVVDSYGAIDEHTRRQLGLLPRLSFALPAPSPFALREDAPYSDEFQAGPVLVSPFAMLAPARAVQALSQPSEAPQLGRLGAAFGGARAAKAAMELWDLESGPLRGPLRPLAPPIRNALHQALSNQAHRAA